MRNYDLEVKIDKKSKAIVKSNKRCVSCGECVKVCLNDIGVLKMCRDNNYNNVCIDCGQCSNICPVEAIHEKFHYLKVKNILKDKKDKVICFSIAPAVRVALGEEFGMSIGTNLEKKIPTVLRKMGADYVFDVTFGADITVMEEAMEFVTRFKNNDKLPQFTSCCPAWVKYAEIFYPEILPNLSTTKSPIAISSVIIKNYFSKSINKDPHDIINIVVAPCTAKKAEAERDELNDMCDYVLTTREFALLIKDFNIDIRKVRDGSYDVPLDTGSGAGVIFGNSGGVMEASIRTAYYFLTGKNLRKKDLIFKDFRGTTGVREAQVEIDNKVIKLLVVNGMGSVRSVIDKVLSGKSDYHFIEVMNCKGGCIAGGGQPKTTLLEMHDVKMKRKLALYMEDLESSVRLCHENPLVKKIYKDYLGSPNSDVAEEILHTEYSDKSYMLGSGSDV